MAKDTKKKTYEVEIRQTLEQGIVVTVEAEDEEEAEDLAYEKLEDVDPDDWEFIDEDSRVIEITEEG